MSKKSFCASHEDTQQALGEWFSSPPGSLLLTRERDLLEQLLEGLFGYYLVQVGCLGVGAAPLHASRIRTQVVVGAGAGGTQPARFLRGSAERLPIASDSVDVLLLPHTLDFTSDPHQVLREAERVLIPEGRLIVVGFNPLSLWGLWRLFRHRSGRVPWCGQFISPRRLNDWLRLMGLEQELGLGLMFRPPLTSRRLMERARLLEPTGQRSWPLLGGAYVIQAVKRVSRLTPVAPLWKIHPGVLGTRWAEPTTRSSNWMKE